MSDVVRTLKADDTVGYWEYEVQNEDGTWIIECTRGEKIDPTRTVNEDDFDKFQMSLRLRLNGEELFDSTQYPPESVPFLGPYEMNAFIIEVALYGLYFWYTTSHRMYQIGETLFRLLTRLHNRTRPGGGVDEEELNLWKPLSEHDMERLQGHGSATSRLAKTLFDYGMESTTPEWRLIYLGTDQPTRAEWQNESDAG